MNKYVKLVVLSTLDEPMSLSEIGNAWFKNKGRLYQPRIIKEINRAVDDGLLIQKGKKYLTNLKLLLDTLIDESYGKSEDERIKKFRETLKQYYIQYGGFTRRVYLNFDLIKSITKLDWRNASTLDILQVFELPLYIEKHIEKDKESLLDSLKIMRLVDCFLLLYKFKKEYGFLDFGGEFKLE